MRTRLTAIVLTAATLTAALAGCSSSTAPAKATPAPVTSATARTSPSRAAAPAKTAPTVSAVAISDALHAHIPSISKVLQIDENNDPNNLIGRPNEYTQAAVMYDSRITCTDVGADCGATVEIWPTAALATSREQYIQGILKSSPALGTEYDLVQGNALLRVAGALKPTEEAQYAAAWKAYFQG